MYEEAVRWLEVQRRAGRRRGAQRLRAVWPRLGIPFPETKMVHVLGTNGKGSVAAYLERGFIAARMSAAAFTSPHLYDVRERVRIGGRFADRGALVSFVQRARALPLADPPAFFEWLLAFALEQFTAASVEWAALEAGVGGASDATMFAAKRVALTIITNIGDDHLQSFGTWESLARDKVGAVQPGVPVVGAVRGRALELLREVSEKRSAPLYVLNPEDPLFSLPDQPALPGAFQRKNAALAVAALRLLGFGDAAVKAAVTEARLPGRLDRRSFNGREVILDGAHNLHAVRALVDELPSRYRLVFGAQPQKAVDEMLDVLAARASGAVLTWPYSGRGAGLSFEPDPVRALLSCADRAEHSEPVVVTGSLYLVGRLLSSGLFD